MSKIADLYGNLARDVEVRFAQSGTAWTTVTVAESNKDRDGNPKPTTWWAVKIFGQQAEDAAELRKGQRVKVEGRIETEEWNDRETGEKRSRLVVIAWPRDGFTAEGSHAPTTSDVTGNSRVRVSDESTPQNDPWAAPSTGGGDSEEAPRGHANATAPYSAPTGDVWGARNTTDEFVNTNRGSDRPF